MIRSRTIFGLSVVQMIFEEGTESYWARQRVQEKLTGLELPEGAKPDMGPLATAYGEIYRYELRTTGEQDLMELRTLNDWVVTPNLIRTPGVADVPIYGERRYAMRIWLDPARLAAFRMTTQDVEDALRRQNVEVPAGRIESRMREVLQGAVGIVRFDGAGTAFLVRERADEAWVTRWRDAAETREGSAILERAPLLLRQSVDTWGTPILPRTLAARIKAALDPRGTLAPGRMAGGL